MALGRFMSGLAIAGLIAATPMAAHATPAAPQPKVEQVSSEAELRGSNRLLGFVTGGVIIAFLLIVLLSQNRGKSTVPPKVSP